MLNKNGWGLREMLLLSGLLILFLFVAIYFIYRFYSEFDKELGNNYYINLEEELEDKALVYLNDYSDKVIGQEEIIISRRVLRAYDLDVDLKDKDGNNCSGYVSANKVDDDLNIKAYISCREYETEGYKGWLK